VPVSHGSSRGVAAPHEVPEGIVRLRDDTLGFLGTGVVVAPGIVLSCAHVCAGSACVRVESARGAHARAELLFPPPPSVSLPHRLATHAGDDLAVLRLDAPLPEPSLRLVEGVTADLLRGTSGELEVAGFRGPRGSVGAARALHLRGAPWRDASGLVRSGQVDGGVPPGLSGSPLLVRRGAEWLMLGLFFLGGEGAGQSTFYGSDLLIALLRRLELGPRTRAADEHLARSQVQPSPDERLGERETPAPHSAAPPTAARGVRYGPGTLIAGKYRIERTLGGGGMGVVVAARHVGLDERVALKLLHEHLALGASDVARFRREARTAARLLGEHVVRIRDVDTTEQGIPYIVMEYLEGHDLAQRLREGPLAVGEAVDFVLQTCAALEEAHAQGVVHRDLKPANLFVSRDARGRTRLKVLDFGIAKALGGAPELALTDTHHLVGSPLYMSPEQMRASSAVGPASDIWSLGVVLFELLTGRVPFPADSIADLCLKVTSEPVPAMRALRPELPEALQAIVTKCLQKDPAQRFATVGALAEALARYASAAPVAAKQTPSRRGRAVAGALAALAALALLAAGATALLLRPGNEAARSGERPVAPLPARPPDPASGRSVDDVDDVDEVDEADASAALRARNDEPTETRPDAGARASEREEAPSPASRRAPARQRAQRPARPPIEAPTTPVPPQDAFPDGRD